MVGYANLRQEHVNLGRLQGFPLHLPLVRRKNASPLPPIRSGGGLVEKYLTSTYFLFQGKSFQLTKVPLILLLSYVVDNIFMEALEKVLESRV